MNELLRHLFEWVERPNCVVTVDDLAPWPMVCREQYVRAGLLVETALATTIRCDGCDRDHVETVFWVCTPGHTHRYFIPCPENGRVTIDPTQLRQWAIQPVGIARGVAATLGITGTIEERSPGRVWKLGTFRAMGRVWCGFLTVGLNRADAESVVAPLAELRAANAVVFVPSVPPTASIWGERPPIVHSLIDLLTLGDTGLSLDRLALDSALTPAAVPLVPTGDIFPTPTGATWDQVEMIVEDLHIVVRVGAVTRRYGYAEAGFENRKTRTPDHAWTLLTLLTQTVGVLEKPDPTNPNAPSLKGSVSVLRTRLRTLLALDGDPFHPPRRGQPYRSRFRVRPATGPVVAIPPGTVWLDLTLTAIDTEAFTVAVGSESEPTRYRVSELGLLAEVRAALRDVFQGHGSVRRPDTDEGMLALNAALSRFLPLEGSPFDFRNGVWTARFEVSTIRQA